MKKKLKTLFIALAILSMGGIMTACDSEMSWLDGIKNIMQNIFGNLSGSTTSYTYEGTCTIEMYDYDSEDGTYDPTSKKTITVSMQPSVEVYATDSAAVINLGTIASGSITVADYTFTTYYAENVIDPDGPTYLTGATCTYNGTANTEVPASCIQGTITTEALKLTNIYFQVGNKVFMNGTFNGTVVTE